MSLDNFEIHPAADIFPMMTEEELQELAADIQANGLHIPIILDHTGKLLIDGRNRLAACRLANVKPLFASISAEEDPLAYIASANLMRRNLTKGQQAMAMAMMYPEDGGKGGRGKKVNLPENGNFGRERLRQARIVLRFSRPLAEEVLRGDGRSLDEALEHVHTEEGKARSRRAQIDELRAKTADLADKVNDGRMKFDDAMAEYHRRLLEQQRIRESVGYAFDGLSKFPGYVAGLHQAIDAGADNPLDDKLMKLLHDSMALLEKVWKETHNGRK